MKVRSCFVSNSSSSSFIIYKGFFRNLDKIEELKSLYNQLVAEGEVYSDSGTFFLEEPNYVSFGSFGGGSQILTKFLADECSIEDKQIFITEG